MKSRHKPNRTLLLLLLACFASLGTTPFAQPTTAAIASVSNPILFVTQVPAPDGFGNISSTFANHIPAMDRVRRGGDLMIRYPDGTLRNLTREAGFGEPGVQQGTRAIAVRDPAVHWNGTKALFSMLIGAPAEQYQYPDYAWQLYEVSGLAQGQTVTIMKVAGQPAGYNNVTPFYDTNDNILFTSDRPRDGSPHLYPQLDEYESSPTITGLWKLDPTTQNVRILNHTPSGLFSPTIDSYGRVIFTRWDHLQRDQQEDGSPSNGKLALSYASEALNAPKIPNSAASVFPEPRPDEPQLVSPSYGPVNPFRFNLFQPWEMNEDGTSELTLNHIGRHELSFGEITKSFSNDPALEDNSDTSIMVNRKSVGMDTGIFQIKEDPANPGTYYGIYAHEFDSLNSGGIVKVNAAPGVNAEQMAFVDVTPAENIHVLPRVVPGGRMRDPLPLTSGKLLAAHTSSTTVVGNIDFRIKELVPGANGLLAAGAPLTSGISRTLSWWSPDNALTYSGPLWEWQPVEVVARARPTPRTTAIEAIEKQVLNEETVDEAALRTWMTNNDLALIVTRNHTSRDRADKQQPYNLQVAVPNGAKTIANNGRVYDIAHYQIFQADQVRSYTDLQGGPSSGRRTLPRPAAIDGNPANGAGPVSSVKIAADGSSAAFVPARKALTWQTTNGAGEFVVRERVWVTFQPGEIRTCAGCHGANSTNQAGSTTVPTNKPQALRDLMQTWKRITGAAAALPFDIDGSGSCDVNTDAVLVLRYLQGVRGPALTAGLKFSRFASRKTPELIEPYIAGLGNAFDIDGDSKTLALTDGLMFLRYAKTLSGASLTTSARNAKVGGGFKTDTEIKTYLDSKCAPIP
jgi:Hydrazine synthase alpha subunit middle domain